MTPENQRRLTRKISTEIHAQITVIMDAIYSATGIEVQIEIPNFDRNLLAAIKKFDAL